MARSAKSKSSSAVRNTNWKDAIDTTILNAYTWSVHVIFLIEFNNSHIKYLDLFNTIAKRGQRSCIKIITMDTLKNSIRRYYGDPSINSEIATLPPECAFYPYASDDAMKYIKKNMTIPTDLLAKLIKLEILREKFAHIEYIDKKRQLNNDINEEFADILLGEQKRCPAQAVPKSSKNPPPVTEETEPPKDTSNKLYKTGEEMVKIYDDIDDSPKFGPNLYIILSMFYDPQLIIELIQNGIPIIGIIQMRRDNDILDDINDIKVEKSKFINAQTFTRRTTDIYNFWYKYANLIKIPEQYKYIEDTAFVTFKTPIFNWDIKTNMVTSDDENQLYNDLSYAFYEIEDFLRQYANYMKNMKILPLDYCPTQQSNNNILTYKNLLNLIPNECTTVPIILNCILEQVSNTISIDDNESIDNNTIDDESINKSTTTINTYYSKYRRKYLQIFKRIEYENRILLPNNIQIKTRPITIDYGNNIKYQTYHLDYINIEEITLNILYYHLIPKLWRSIININDENILFYDCHITKLLNETTNKNVDRDVLWHYLHIKILEKMTCTSKIYTFNMESLNELSNDGKELNLGSINKINNLFSHNNYKKTLRDILFSNDLSKLFQRLDQFKSTATNNSFNMTGYRSYELLNISVMLQQLYDASITFNCIDYYHFPYTDVLLLQFHNNLPREQLIKDDWEIYIPTFVCFRDFVNYVYNENEEWIHEQENYYKHLCEIEDEKDIVRYNIQKANEALLKMEPGTNFNESLQIIPEESDLLLPGSIKEQIYLQKKEELEQKLATSTDKKQNQTKKEVSGKGGKSSGGGSKSAGKGGKGGAKGNPQQQLELNLFPPYPPESPYYKITLPVKTADVTDENANNYEFIGYDLGNDYRRIQLTGQTQYILSDDQSSIKCELIQKTYTTNKTLSIELLKHMHSLYLYSEVSTNNPIHMNEFIFHLNVANGIIISFSTTSPNVVPTSSPNETIPSSREIDEEENETIDSNNSIIRRNINNTTSDFDITNESTKPSSSVKKLSPTKSKRMSRQSMISQQSPITEPPQLEIDNKFVQRQNEEKRLHKYLMKLSTEMDVLTPRLVSESEFLKTKDEIIEQLEMARENYSPCYKIHSSKLHIYRYIKRIKPYITVNIGGILKKLTFRPSSTNNINKSNSDTTKIHAKWKRLSTKYNEPLIPLNFEFRCSWPNGLNIKTVPTHFDYMPYYIKQYFIPQIISSNMNNFDEISRCYLSNGTVLIFRTEGRLKILCPDTSMYNCQIDGFKPITLKPKTHNVGQKKRLNMTTMYNRKCFKDILRHHIHIRKHLINGQQSLRMFTPYSRRIYLRKQKYCYRIATEMYKKQSDLIPIPEYTCILPDGTKSTIRNNRICGIPSKLFVDIATDLLHNEIYIEREDNTISLLHGDNGILEISYADGTRITTGYEIEDDDICIDFQDDELQTLLTAIQTARLESLALINNDDDDIYNNENDLIFEPFVSIILVCTFEHPKYASITYRGGNDFSTEILMTDDVSINIDKTGQYVCDLDNYTKLSVLSSLIIFERVTCCACTSRSRSEINYLPFIQQQNESTNNINSEDDDCFYVSNVNTSGQHVFIDFNGNILCEHDKKIIDNQQLQHTCKSYLDNRLIDRRYFLLKRSLNGTEFIHENEQKKYIEQSLNRKFSSVYRDSSNDETYNDNSIIVVYGLDKNYSENWIMPFNRILPLNIRRKDSLPSTYYPGGWLSAFPKYESNYLCCTDILNQTTSTMMMATTQKIPSAMLRRQFISLEIYCDQIIGTTPLLYKSVSNVNIIKKIAKSHGHYPHPIYRKSSALDFRNRWKNKQNEMEYYRNELKQRNVPKYFSEDMETIMFNKSCKKYTDSELNEPVTITPMVTDNTDKYHVDLVGIAKKWAKHGYIRYQPQFKKHMNTAIQTDSVQFLNDKISNEIMDEQTELMKPCKCYKTSRIPRLYKPIDRHINNKQYVYHSEPILIDIDSITARTFKRPLSVGNTGSIPYVQSMSLHLSPRSIDEISIDKDTSVSSSNQIDDNMKVCTKNSQQPADCSSIPKMNQNNKSEMKVIYHKSLYVPTIYISNQTGNTVPGGEHSQMNTLNYKSQDRLNNENSKPKLTRRNVIRKDGIFDINAAVEDE